MFHSLAIFVSGFNKLCWCHWKDFPPDQAIFVSGSNWMPWWRHLQEVQKFLPDFSSLSSVFTWVFNLVMKIRDLLTMTKYCMLLLVTTHKLKVLNQQMLYDIISWPIGLNALCSRCFYISCIGLAKLKIYHIKMCKLHTQYLFSSLW